jgi:hypothetical protein
MIVSRQSSNAFIFTVILERRNMSRESTEELRRRLLRDERVRELISRRAYEIYVMRGGRPGGEGQDWFQAESEILSILIEEESRRSAESTEPNADQGSQPVDEANDASPVDEANDGSLVGEAIGVPETSDRLEQESGLTAEERAESQSAIATWSPTEPESEERAPTIGHVDESQTGAAAPKKTRSRAAAKPDAPRKSESSTKKSDAVKEPAAKKTTAKRTASKRSAGPPKKTTRSRKKTGDT